MASLGYGCRRILFPLVFFFHALPSTAQITTASLQGLVRDASGAVIQGAEVQVVNMDTNVAQPLTTNTAGRFLAPSLPAGRYKVIVLASGFKRLEREGITLDIDQAQELDLAMELGEAKETVEVSADVAQLDTASAETGQVVDTHAITNLPLNERNPWQLLSLAAGVIGGSGVTDVYNNFNNVVINGGRSGSNAILIDGILSSMPLPGPQNSGTSAFPSVDLIQEFKVETNYPAEFGRTGGGIINLIYKSGTNSLHGDLYEFLRNSDLDSNNFFSNRAGVGLPVFRRNQFGGTVGGPVYIPKLYHGRNKTFFMFGYEALKESTATTLNTSVPTAAEAQGDFSQLKSASGAPVVIYDPLTTVASGSAYVRTPFAGNIIPSSRIDPVAANVFKYFPSPNQPGNAGTALNNYYDATASPENIYDLSGKVDENLNDKNRFFLRASRHWYNVPAPHEVNDYIAESTNTAIQRFFNGAADYTFTASPTFLTDVRYGYGRVTVSAIPPGAGFSPTSLGFPSYMDDGQELMFPSFGASNYYTLGINAPQVVGTDTHSLGIRSMKVLTNHLLKFGFEFLVLQVNEKQGGSGTFTFTPAYSQGPNPNVASATGGNSLASFLLGAGTGSLTLYNQPATTSKYYAGYIADDWKLNSKLTLNIGFRYGVDTAFTERYGRFFTFDPSVTSPLATLPGLANLKGGEIFPGLNGNSREAVPTDFNGWDPRFGFAYHLWKNTVLRGGYGIFHTPTLDEANANSITGFGSTTSFISSASGLVPTSFLSNPFPGGIVPATGNSQGLLTNVGTAVNAMIPNYAYRVPYSESWNFNVQHELPGGIRVEAGYVGNHGLFYAFTLSSVNLDQLRPEQLSSALQQQVPNPFYGHITTGTLSTATVPLSYLVAPFPQFLSLVNGPFPGAFGTYEAFQLKVEKRFGSAGSFLLSYAKQKILGNGTPIIYQNIYNLTAAKSISTFDVPQSLVLSYVYNLPFGKGKRFGNSWNRPMNWALGGWQINGITTFSSGVPLSLTTQNTSDSGSETLYPNNNGHSALLSGSVISRVNQYFNTSVFSQPAPFTFGNIGFSLPNVRAPGVNNFDLSLFKNFHPLEKLTLQFHAEAFNAFNRVQFGAPNEVLSSGQFGVISTQANTPRQIQFALKLLF